LAYSLYIIFWVFFIIFLIFGSLFSSSGCFCLLIYLVLFSFFGFTWHVKTL
jgi:hypothetical protein